MRDMDFRLVEGRCRATYTHPAVGVSEAKLGGPRLMSSQASVMTKGCVCGSAASRAHGKLLARVRRRLWAGRGAPGSWALQLSLQANRIHAAARVLRCWSAAAHTVWCCGI